jgi:choline dehydrogenase-like flavoprotein
MPTSRTAQTTQFTRDVLGRYICNGIDEALQSTDKNAFRPDGSPQSDARPFDIVVIGGGSFGPVVAQHLFAQDKTRSHRILVLEAGSFLLTEHVQNLPTLGLHPPGPTTADPGVARNEVWGLPWRTNDQFGFPGLAYCVGGRSIFFGGWSPQLLEAETLQWPASVMNELRNPLPDGSPGYFRQASEQIGTNVTNDFISGELHRALRYQLFSGIVGGDVPAAIPLASLPLTIDVPSSTPPVVRNLLKLEAPLAVQSRSQPGLFPSNKFSAVPLMMQATRSASFESMKGLPYPDDVKKRLMIVPQCHVIRLVTDVTGGMGQVTAVQARVYTGFCSSTGVESSDVTIPVADGGKVIIALGTIESTRLALLSFPGITNYDLIGQNLLAHLRSNLTIRIPRDALVALNPAVRALQASALFVKGQHTHTDGTVGRFHLQITAAGLEQPGTNSEAELFKKIPDLETLDAMRQADDESVVITIRGIGEMEPQNPASNITLAAEADEVGVQRAFVEITPSAKDNGLWDAMDQAADDVAKIFAGTEGFEVLTQEGFKSVTAGDPTNQLPVLVPYTHMATGGRRDGLGTTHHEAGPLWMGDNPSTSVTDVNGRFHFVSNAYVAGPALFPTVGSPNPMLTGVALGRRLADHLAQVPPVTPDPGFTLLFDGANMDKWQMSTIKNQPGKDNPGAFLLVDGTLESLPGTDLGLLWHTDPTPPNFVLKLEWLRWRDDDNSGVFIRFPHPDSKGYNNTAYVAIHFGFEVQIDQLARDDGASIHKTGAIYDLAGPATPDALPVNPPGQWNEFEIRVEGQDYTVFLNGTQITTLTFAVGSDPAHLDRGLPTSAGDPRFVGLQTHTGRVAFRKIQIKPLP